MFESYRYGISLLATNLNYRHFLFLEQRTTKDKLSLRKFSTTYIFRAIATTEPALSEPESNRLPLNVKRGYIALTDRSSDRHARSEE